MNRTKIRKEKLEDSNRALGLRISGATYESIAREMGMANRSVAYKAVQRGLSAIPAESATELRRMESERLDELTSALWPEARAGNAQAIDRALKIMERRARLLGLDSPAKAEVSVSEGVSLEDLDRLREAVALNDAETRELG